MTTTTWTFDTQGDVILGWIIPFHTPGSLTIRLRGGDGHHPSSHPLLRGGSPGDVDATVTLAPGTAIDIFVGAPGRQDGVAPGPARYDGGAGRISGGSASAVEVGGVPILVAGGGGSGGGGAFGGRGGGRGGHGVADGESQTPLAANSFDGGNGQGGSLSGAGAGGAAATTAPPGYDGLAGVGHVGGSYGNSGSGGSGGGGGYYGGGAGGTNWGGMGGGGGGGSTWVDTGVCSSATGWDATVRGYGDDSGLVEITMDYLGDWVERRPRTSVGILVVGAGVSSS